ncbi:MAG: hypothetical protein K0B02_02335 [DPANN group archaeon]|nr:hypothetical protein [DPANN group archaeon]
MRGDIKSQYLDGLRELKSYLGDEDIDDFSLTSLFEDLKKLKQKMSYIKDKTSKGLSTYVEGDNHILTVSDELTKDSSVYRIKDEYAHSASYLRKIVSDLESLSIIADN